MGKSIFPGFDGQESRFCHSLLGRIEIVLKNLIFFTPRREVLVEIEPAPADLPASGARLDFNRYLERWYNSKGLEPIKLVTDCFWKESFPKSKIRKKLSSMMKSGR